MAVFLGNPALAYTDRLFTSGKSDAPDEASGNAYVFQFEDIGEVEGSGLQGNEEWRKQNPAG